MAKGPIVQKWVYRNKKDERGIVIRNKARLVAQGHTQEEGIDYDEVFAPVARIDAIMLFLAYASYKDFVVYQMDVKSAFLYGKIEEEKMCTEFEKMMHKKFQISSMGGLTFFLGLQVKQKEDGIFISQDKYVTEILKKFGFSDVKTATTPMETHKALPKDPDGEDVDEHLYRSMIGSLMYLTSSRPDIMFAVCTCARFHVNPKISHLHAVKMIFRYLKGQPKLGLWYPKDSPFELVAYTDSDYIGASLDWKSTTGGCQFLGFRLISWQCKKQNVVANSTIEVEYIAASNCYRQDTVKAKTVNGEVQLQALVDKKKVIINESTIRRDLQLEDANGVDCLPNAAIFEQLALMGGPTEPMADETENVESVPTHSNDPLLSGEDCLKLNELIELCTTLQKKVLDLETSKTTQTLKIESLKRRVKKLEQKQRERKTLNIDSGAKDITLDSTHVDTDPDMFGVHDLHGDEVFVEIEEHVVNVKGQGSKDKGKEKMIEPEKPLKKKDQDKVRTDYELAQRLQQEKQEELTIEEKVIDKAIKGVKPLLTLGTASWWRYLKGKESSKRDGGNRTRMQFSKRAVYLLYGSAGVRVVTAAYGRSYKESSRSEAADIVWFETF
ncbi:putative ribonuclease H-like domain-containing protein [Tanacetum coccineum]